MQYSNCKKRCLWPIMKGLLKISYCPTEFQLADDFTNAPKIDRFELKGQVRNDMLVELWIKGVCLLG